MRLLAILCVVAAASGAALAQSTNAPEVRTMSLEDCLQVALEHNLDVQIERYNPEFARYALSSAKWAYDPQLRVDGGHEYRQSPGGIDAEGRLFGGTETEVDDFNVGLSGRLPYGGPIYTIGGGVTDSYGRQPQTIFDTNGVPIGAALLPFERAGASMGFFSLQQPLLKNLWIDDTRLQILLETKNLKISELQLRLQVMQTITSVEQAYYRLIYNQENVEVQRAALKLADRLLEENRKRVQVGALAPLDEKQAEAQAAGSRADLLGALGEEDTQQRELKNMLSDDYSQWKDVRIQPAEKLVAVPEQFDLQESWRRGISQRPELLEFQLNLQKQGYVVKYSKNQMLPQLDIVGSAAWSGSGDEIHRAMDQVSGMDNPAWSVGGQLTMPIFNRAAINRYRVAKATRDQMALQFKQAQQRVLIDIENGIAVARTAFQRVQATREARVYAQEALQAEEKKLASGKSTSFEVLRLQRDLTSASSAEIRALAEYNISLANIALYEGSTLERRKISLETKKP
jgi:outer membrane protein TolC